MTGTPLAPYIENMTQLATYWAPGTTDGYGGVTYQAAILIMCRWQSKETLVRSKDGQELTSDTTVYVDRPLLAKGYIVLGDETAYTNDPFAVDDARQIISVNTSPSLSGDQQLNSVLL